MPKWLDTTRRGLAYVAYGLRTVMLISELAVRWTITAECMTME